MAGNKLAKHKTLAVYDYFLKKVSGANQNHPATVEEIRDELHEVFGDSFERKSIYNDIDTINEYKRMEYGDPEFNWIERKGTNTYVRNYGKDELRKDEVSLIYDAINATPIAGENIANKFKKTWPVYFEEDDSAAFITVAKKNTMVFETMMKKIKSAVKDKNVLKIDYGYKLNDGDPKHVCAEERHISPIGLYYGDSSYYLFAIDNHKYVEAMSRKMSVKEAQVYSLRQFRIDRIDTKVEIRPHETFYDCDVKIVKDKIAGAVNAFASDILMDVIISISGNPKTVIKAYDYLKHEVRVKSIISDGWSNGKIKFAVEVSPSANLYRLFAQLTAFSTDGEDAASGLKIKIEGDNSERLKEEYIKFMDRARENVIFE